MGTRRPVMTMSAGAVNHKPRALVEKLLLCGGNGIWVCARASEFSKGSKTSAALAAARCSQRAEIEGVERCMGGLVVADL